MRLGLNTFLFTAAFDHEDSAVLECARAYGAESIELAISDPAAIDADRLKAALDASGFATPVLCGVFSAGRDLRGSEAEAAGASAYVENLIRLAGLLGSKVICGPMYAQTGVRRALGQAERDAEQDRLAGRFRPLCERAGDAGILLAIEPLNRFETDCINTLDQGAALIEAVGHPALRLHIDTFHMHIEETDPWAAIAAHGPLIGHVHASANHRGDLHRCQIDWLALLESLHSAGYTGDIVIESFAPEDPAMAEALCLWRPLFSSREVLAREGLRLLRRARDRVAGLPLPTPPFIASL